MRQARETILALARRNSRFRTPVVSIIRKIIEKVVIKLEGITQGRE